MVFDRSVGSTSNETLDPLAPHTPPAASLAIAHTWDGVSVPVSSRARIDLWAEPRWLRIAVDAPFWSDPPPPGPAGLLDGLWAFEVVELFLAEGSPRSEHSNRYVEVELSPHGHHLTLLLRGIRQRVAQVPISFRALRRPHRWCGMAMLPWSCVPSGPLIANAYAIHGQGDARQHLAMATVPGAQPDFHRLDRFVPIAIRRPNGPKARV